ncbi:polysaccharide deacetylase domain-containing protein [Trichoderma breve]|uniref:Polysaccharide deacetylase domain-containing protein n=1 Tax=Trichoderma breve TaxID=2034170 RepID=A0A9W9E8N9_9HYPO|nr:polysaccharide deacetylase domain-containing protein [Trichoderma breve]KAJ4860617.1 polysaccharide deacetylase domain-containing protein [Trichoderma breve]
MKHLKVAIGVIALVITQTAAVPQASIAAENTLCGPGLGSCVGGCCSEFGHCGTTTQYCSGSQCQLDYSDSCDTQVGPGGRSTESIDRPFFGDVPYAETITECDSPGLVALTFDDGPYEYTNQLLDLLDEYKVKATFFIAGHNRGKGRIDDESTGYPRVLRRMRNAGHQLASHTWTHRNLNGVSEHVQRTEMIYNEMAFRNIFGFVPTYMRPPFLDTNLDTKDYENDDPVLIQKSKDKFFSMQSSDETDHSYIVLAHDVHYQTVVTLAKYMIETSRERGYKLVTVGECLGDPPENWYRLAPSRRGLDTYQEIPPVNDTNQELPPVNNDTNPWTPPGNNTNPWAPPENNTNPWTPPENNTNPWTPPINNTDPGETPKLNVSTDQRCGVEHGNTTCKDSLFGDCCSYFGYCGRSDDYCITSCDRNFGVCNLPLGDDKVQAPIHDTTNGLCGRAHTATCLHFGKKKCCSQWGFCGNSEDHCLKGCQKGYGLCFTSGNFTEV